MRMAEKSLLLQLLDQHWKDHLLQLDHLRQGIHLRAYGQRDPLNEYKREAFELFEGMLCQLRETVTTVLSHVQIRVSGSRGSVARPARPRFRRAAGDPIPRSAMADGEPAPQPPGDGAAARAVQRRPATAAVDPADPSTWGRTPRNATCPCGSGKKFKHCHGKV